MSESKQKTIVFIESFQFCHLEKVSRSQSKQKTIAFIDSFKFCDLEKGPRSHTNRMVSAWKWRLVLHFSDTPATFKSGECWQKLSWHCQIQHVIIRDKLETWSWRRFEERKKNKQTNKQTKTPHRPSNEQTIMALSNSTCYHQGQAWNLKLKEIWRKKNKQTDKQTNKNSPQTIQWTDYQTDSLRHKHWLLHHKALLLLRVSVSDLLLLNVREWIALAVMSLRIYCQTKHRSSQRFTGSERQRVNCAHRHVP